MASLSTGAGAGTSLHERRALSPPRKAPTLVRPVPVRTIGQSGPASPRTAGPNGVSLPYAVPRRLSSPKMLRPGEGRPLSPSSRRSPPVIGGLPSPGYSEAELEAFVGLCQAAYYNADQSAVKLVEQTVRNQPQSCRAVFIKAQSGVRVQFHRDMELKRRRDLADSLAKTEPGCVVSKLVGGSSAAAMRSGKARHERRSRLARFLSNHALKSMPGPHPFLRSLHAALRLQGMPVTDGGAGKRLVEWDVDDAVLMEAGKDFLRDSVELLKGVLGMDDVLRDLTSSYVDGSDSESDLEEPMSPPPTMHAHQPTNSCSSEAPSRPDALARGRSGSDPFTDPPTPSVDGLTPPVSASAPLLPPTLPPRKLSSSNHAHMPPPRSRTFHLPPYLTDGELVELAGLFPSWITSIARGGSAKGLEEGSGGGHGTLRIGQRPRDEGFTGTVLERFLMWWRRLFGI